MHNTKRRDFDRKARTRKMHDQDAQESINKAVGCFGSALLFLCSRLELQAGTCADSQNAVRRARAQRAYLSASANNKAQQKISAKSG